ncbi:hypothetical protein CsSME_00045924 [Camellia sinensis var. sinensis]
MCFLPSCCPSTNTNTRHKTHPAPFSSPANIPTTAVKFLYLGMNELRIESLGQNTVNPPSRFSLNVDSAPEDFNRSANDLQPCFAIRTVKLSWDGPGIGASASAEFKI